MIFVEQSSTLNSCPVSQRPRKVPPSDLRMVVLPSGSIVARQGPVGAPLSASPEKEGFSGQMPVSRSPTTMPDPASLWEPPCCFQTPRLPYMPRNFAELMRASGVRASTGITA